MGLDELMEKYSSELYQKFPLFFKYLETINLFANYTLQITEMLEEQFADFSEYQNEVDLTFLVEMCCEILSSIDEKLSDKFKKFLIDGTVSLEDEVKLGFSSMTIDNGKINIEIDRRYNIEDVLGLIHEFFHGIHIEKFNNRLDDQNWYIFTESIALTGELYALIYMYQNDILKEDIIEYFKKLMNSILIHADTCFLTGLALDIYDNEGSVSAEAISHYIELKQMPEEYKDIDILLESLDDFLFHESATYIFGFPIALLIASKMMSDEEYHHKFIRLLGHINEYPLESFLNLLGIDEILVDEDYMCYAINYIYNVSHRIINKEKVNIKSLLVETR